jgi:hypothetical protein
MTVALAVLLLVSAAATAGMCYWHLQSVRQLQFAQEHVANINRNKALVQSLASESVEYGRRNPEILRLLQGLGIRSRGDTNSPALEARP